MGPLVTIPLTGIALGIVGADGVEELPLVSITLKAEGEGVSLYEVLVRRGDMLLDVADAAPGTNVDDWVMLGLTTA